METSTTGLYYILQLLNVSTWWSSEYNCRKQLTATAGSSSLASGSFIRFSFDHQTLVSDGKSLSSGDDVRVLYGTDSTELDRSLSGGSSWNATDTAIVVRSQTDISAGASDSSYYIYYCNSSASAVTSSIPDGPAATVESLTTTTAVNNTTYNQVAGSTFTPASTSEVWLWFVTYAIKSDVNQSNNDTSFLGRITVNGTSDTEMEQQSNEGDRWKTLLAAGRVTGTTATQTIAMDIKSALVTTTTSVKNVRIVSILMPSDADFQYAANDTLVQVTNGAFADIADPQLTFTPSSAGDYFIIATGQHHENPDTSVSQLRFVDNGGGYWPTLDTYYSANNRGSFDSFFVMRKITLAASSHTFKFQFQSGGGGGGSEYKGLRIFAFRADAFELTESQVDLAASNTTSGTAVTKSTLTTTAPSSSSNFLVVQSNWVYDNSTTTTHQELADFRKDGTVLSDSDHVLNRDLDYQFASGIISTMTTSSSHTFDNRYWTNDGDATYSKESVIHVLQMKEASGSLGSEESQ